MPAAQSLTQSPPSDLAEADRTARQLRQLAELSELAMDHARTTRRAAQANPSPETNAAFESAARTVTRIIALENWITRPHARKAAAEARETSAATARKQATQTASLRHETDQTIAITEFLSPQQRYRCRTYLSGLDLGPDLSRPIPELIARICRALSIPVPEAFAEPKPEAPPASAAPPPPPLKPAPIPPHPSIAAASLSPIPPD